MAEIDVYQRYYEGECTVNGRDRHGVDVKLTSISEQGLIQYKVSVNFFPHDDETDFAVSYDGYCETVIFEGKGRRSKKREEGFLEELQENTDTLAESMAGKIYWDKPLRPERRG